MLIGRLTDGPEAVAFQLKDNREMAIEKVASFIYIDVLITYNSNNSKEIDTRVV